MDLECWNLKFCSPSIKHLCKRGQSEIEFYFKTLFKIKLNNDIFFV